jgi:hypothetical protein
MGRDTLKLKIAGFIQGQAEGRFAIMTLLILGLTWMFFLFCLIFDGR